MARRTRNTNRDTQREIRSDVNAALRARQAMRLRAQKFTYDEIAAQCGYASRGAARNAIQRELRRYMNEAVTELMRAEEAILYDDIQRVVYVLAVPDTGKRPDLFAVDRLLATSKSRRELFGLDAEKNQGGGQSVRREYVGVNIEGV